jgi:hypothetical protein
MMKKSEIKITEKKSAKIGLVKYGLPSTKEGRLKSFVPGGVKPSPSKRRLSTEDLLMGARLLGEAGKPY